jgi:glycosyltransferase involved in cell wall biosynthesis
VNLAERAGVYGLQELVTDLGYLPEGHLTTVTSGAVALVVPSLFESASFPIWEAFRLGVPVAASSVTALPAQVGDAGLIFDPRSVEQLKNAIATLWTDAEMRDQYIERGSARVRDFTWEKSAEEFLELYRAVASSSSREGVNNFSVEPRL